MNTAVNITELHQAFIDAFKAHKAVEVKNYTQAIKVIYNHHILCEVKEDGEITLDSDGMKTLAVKDYLNLCLEILKKQDRVIQTGFKWYINGLDSTVFTRHFKMTTY